MSEHFGPFEVRRDPNMEPGEWRIIPGEPRQDQREAIMEAARAALRQDADKAHVTITVRKDVLRSMVEAGIATEGDGIIDIHRICMFPRGRYHVVKIEDLHIHAKMTDYEQVDGA